MTPRTVRSLGYVILSQLFKICVCQPCERREDEPIAHPLEIWGIYLFFHKQFQIVKPHVAALATWQRWMEPRIWVTAERALADCSHRHLLQTVQVFGTVRGGYM